MAGGPFISEIHYDNAGADSGEFVEICAPAGTDMTGFELVLYNGSNGNSYDTVSLTGVTACGTSGGKDFYELNISGIQNGAPDGMALVNASGTVCEFLSYEGSFTANNGPASGMTSVDIGVSETSSTAIGESLALNPATGMWEGPQAETPCAAFCYLEGTQILAADGYKNIEDLNNGDTVLDAAGNAHTIKWIGIQTKTPENKTELPIQIAAGSLGENIPSKPLCLSPNHAVLVDGLLINAGALVNGLNINRLELTESYRYFHIELDSHQLLVAENTPSESYMAYKDNRDSFDNAAEAPDNNVMYFPLKFPRISSLLRVPENIKSAILSRAKNIKLSQTA